MDKISQKIISKIELNPTIPITKLAKELRTSRDKVELRLKKLEESKTIINYGAIFNRSFFNQLSVVVLIRTKLLNQNMKQELLKYLINHNRTTWISEIIGNWDIYCVISTKNTMDLCDFEFEIKNKFNENIDNFITLPNFTSQSWEEIKKGKKGFPVNIKLDEEDYKIMKQLSKNCRSSLIEIGKNTGIDAKTVFNRKKKYKESNLYTGDFVNIDYNKLGLKHFKILIKISSFKKEEIEKFTSQSKVNPKVKHFHLIAGEWNIVIDIIAKDKDELNSILNDISNNSPGMIHSYSIVQINNYLKRDSFPKCFIEETH